MIQKDASIRTVSRKKCRRTVQNIRPEAVILFFLSRMFANGSQDYAPYSKSLMSLAKVLTRYVPILPLRHLPTIIGPNIPEPLTIV
jgi:hypothetical protein